MRRGFVVLLLAACGSTAPVPAPASPAAPAPAPAAPATRAPSVQWIDNGFDAYELPATAADGSRVVLPIIDADGGRGMPNLRLSLRDRDDRELHVQIVLRPEETEQMFDAGGLKPELRARIRDANSWLREQHGSARLVAMTKLEPADYGVTYRASAGAVSVDWKDSALRISDGARVLVERTTPNSWLAPDRKTCDGCPPCSNPAYLGGAAVDVARRTAVITIAYSGTDMCWEPNAQHHVVTW